MSRLRLRVIPVLVAMAAGVAFAESARAQDVTSFDFANGDVGVMSEQALSGIAGDQLGTTVIAPTTNVASRDSAVGVPQGVVSTSIGVEIVTPQVGGMRVLGAGIIGRGTTGTGIF